MSSGVCTGGRHTGSAGPRVGSADWLASSNLGRNMRNIIYSLCKLNHLLNNGSY